MKSAYEKAVNFIWKDPRLACHVYLSRKTIGAGQNYIIEAPNGDKIVIAQCTFLAIGDPYRGGVLLYDGYDFGQHIYGYHNASYLKYWTDRHFGRRENFCTSIVNRFKRLGRLLRKTKE